MAKVWIGYGLYPINKFMVDGVLNDFEFRKYVQKIANAGANCWRLLPFSVWGVSSVNEVFSPYQVAGGKFDLTKWRPEYFDTMRKVFKILRQYGILPIFDLFDNCQLGQDTKRFSPWANNVQGVSSFYVPAADKFSRLWIEKCLQEFKGIAYGQCNEGADGIVRMAGAVINPALNVAGLMPWVFGATYKTSGRETLLALKKQAEIYFGEKRSRFGTMRPTHGCTNEKDDQFYHPLGMWGGGHPICILFEDDGVSDGDSACDRNMDGNKVWARPSASTWNNMAKIAIRDKKVASIGFIHSPEKGEDIKCQVTTIAAISKAYHEITGEWPKNWQRWPAPIEKVIEQPEPIEVEPETYTPSFWSWLKAVLEYLFNKIFRKEGEN
mgnify:CR=1 FL=1